MQNPINTVPIQQFMQQVKAADLTQQREIKLDIKTAKALAYCLGEVRQNFSKTTISYLNDWNLVRVRLLLYKWMAVAFLPNN